MAKPTWRDISANFSGANQAIQGAAQSFANTSKIASNIQNKFATDAAQEELLKQRAIENERANANLLLQQAANKRADEGLMLQQAADKRAADEALAKTKAVKQDREFGTAILGLTGMKTLDEKKKAWAEILKANPDLAPMNSAQIGLFNNVMTDPNAMTEYQKQMLELKKKEIAGKETENVGKQADKALEAFAATPKQVLKEQDLAAQMSKLDAAIAAATEQAKKEASAKGYGPESVEYKQLMDNAFEAGIDATPDIQYRNKDELLRSMLQLTPPSSTTSMSKLQQLARESEAARLLDANTPEAKRAAYAKAAADEAKASQKAYTDAATEVDSLLAQANAKGDKNTIEEINSLQEKIKQLRAGGTPVQALTKAMQEFKENKKLEEKRSYDKAEKQKAQIVKDKLSLENAQANGLDWASDVIAEVPHKTGGRNSKENALLKELKAQYKEDPSLLIDDMYKIGKGDALSSILNSSLSDDATMPWSTDKETRIRDLIKQNITQLLKLK